MSNYQIGPAEVLNVDNPSEPLIVGCDITTQDFSEIAGEFIFIKPIMAFPVSENPFPKMERMTPVDLAYPLQEAFMLGLILPTNYEVEQLPEPIRVVMPNNAAVFTYNAFLDGNILHLTSVLHLNQTLYLPEEYTAIQSFFDYVARKHEEGIVLKKIQ